MNILQLIIIVLVPVVLIDAAWLYTVGARVYPRYIGHLMRSGGIKWAPVIFFYILYATGIANFVLQPALKLGWGRGDTIMMGMLFGLVVYGAYDLTNHATLRDWNWRMTVIDMAWGSVVTGLSVYAAMIFVG